MGMRCKVKIVKPLAGVYVQLQPEIGKVYDAHYSEARSGKARYKSAEFCVIDINGKPIIARRGEFEIVE